MSHIFAIRRVHMIRLGIAVWAGVVVAGFLFWEASEAIPKGLGTTPPSVPTDRGGPSVVVFVHPQCPCTRAVLPELVAVLAAAPAGTRTQIVFVRPPGVPAGWERTRSWEIAVGGPNIDVHCDPDGIQAAAEGAETSGYAVARDATGKVAFRGGIGRTRGGAKPGLRAVADVLAGRAPAIGEVVVFGCPLVTP